MKSRSKIPRIASLLFPQILPRCSDSLVKRKDSDIFPCLTSRVEEFKSSPGPLILRRGSDGEGWVDPDYPTKPPPIRVFRRVCSEIVPGKLFISGSVVAEDWQALESVGITHVLNLACTVSKCPFRNKIEYLALGLLDSAKSDISSYFYTCIDFIENANGPVLVHCMEGVSRSCTIVIAYLMWKRNISYSEASEIVRSIRPISDPNFGFIAQLLEFQNWTRKNTQIWRVTAVSFDAKLPLVFVPKKVEASKTLDPRFVYIIQTGHEFEIIGPEFHTGKEIAKTIARIEHYKNPEITHIQQCAAEFEFAVSPELNAEAEHHRIHEKLLDTIPESNKPETQVYTLDYESGEKSEGPIPQFDPDDLDSKNIYSFTQNAETTIWIGKYTDKIFPVPPEIRIVYEEDEPDDFWALF